MNLENLFSPDVKFYNNQYTRGEYERKTDWIAQTLASCQVHVAALVEVEPFLVTDNKTRSSPDVSIALYRTSTATSVARTEPLGTGIFQTHPIFDSSA